MGSINKFGLDVGATNEGRMLVGGVCAHQPQNRRLAGAYTCDRCKDNRD